MTERKLELVLYSVYVGAVMLMILLVWQFLLGPLYEAENKNFNAHFIAVAAAEDVQGIEGLNGTVAPKTNNNVGTVIVTFVNGSSLTLDDFLKMPENSNYSIAGKNWTTIPNSSIAIPCCPSPWYPTEEMSKH